MASKEKDQEKEDVMELLIPAIMLVSLIVGFLRYVEKFENDNVIDGYDPHYTRQLEQKEFGYKFTRCENEKCTECFPPVPPKGPAGVSRAPIQQNRRVEINGYWCTRPKFVPPHAHAELVDKDFMGYPYNHIVFRWTASESGRQMAARQAALPVEY